MRGDRPDVLSIFNEINWFTPHARGSTLFLPFSGPGLYVYPACAGIDLSGSEANVMTVCLPRMRGDRPIFFLYILFQFVFTPHARGSTLLLAGGTSRQEVYPACAGIDPGIRRSPFLRGCLPRMRGDRPRSLPPSDKGNRFTPHARGSTPSTSPIIIPS